MLIASDQVAKVLTVVAVIPGSNTLIDVVPQRLREREAHGVAAHTMIMPVLSTVVNKVTLPCLTCDEPDTLNQR